MSRRPAILRAVTAASLLTSLGAPPSGGQRAATDGPRIEMADIRRFWAAYDAGAQLGLTTALDLLYLAPGSPGLHDFARMRIGDAAALARSVASDSAFYAAARQPMLALEGQTDAIRAVFGRLASLYDQPAFPDVYFVVGRRSAAGTVSNAGLLLAAELLSGVPIAGKQPLLAPEDAPAVVAHELVHYQQHIVGQSLLAMTLREGGADFLAERLSGRRLNPTLHAWIAGRARDLWSRFQTEMNAPSTNEWFDAPRDPSQPRDVAYALGYQIVACYFAHASDERAAMRETLHIADPLAYLRASHYDGSPP